MDKWIYVITNFFLTIFSSCFETFFITASHCLFYIFCQKLVFILHVPSQKIEQLFKRNERKNFFLVAYKRAFELLSRIYDLSRIFPIRPEVDILKFEQDGIFQHVRMYVFIYIQQVKKQVILYENNHNLQYHKFFYSQFLFSSL